MGLQQTKPCQEIQQVIWRTEYLEIWYFWSEWEDIFHLVCLLLVERRRPFRSLADQQNRCNYASGDELRMARNYEILRSMYHNSLEQTQISVDKHNKNNCVLKATLCTADPNLHAPASHPTTGEVSSFWTDISCAIICSYALTSVETTKRTCEQYTLW